MNNNDIINPYQHLAQRARVGVLISYFGLLLSFALSILIWPSCNREASAVVWVIYTLPMLSFVYGIVKKNVRSHVWVAFICLGYFLISVNSIFACYGLLTAAEIALTVMLFTSATLYIRWHSRELKFSAISIDDSTPKSN